jgi:hypothetical protein
VANRCPLTWENGVAEATVRPSQEDTCSVRSSHSPDQLTVTFDDDHAVADAGLILAASLAEGLGLRELFDTHVDLGDAPGAANVGDKAMALLHSALAGGEWIGDADALRAGVTRQVLGHRVAAPSTLGTFCARSPGARPGNSTRSPGSHWPARGRRVPGRDRGR